MLQKNLHLWKKKTSKIMYIENENIIALNVKIVAHQE